MRLRSMWILLAGVAAVLNWPSALATTPSSELEGRWGSTYPQANGYEFDILGAEIKFKGCKWMKFSVVPYAGEVTNGRHWVAIDIQGKCGAKLENRLQWYPVIAFEITDDDHPVHSAWVNFFPSREKMSPDALAMSAAYVKGELHPPLPQVRELSVPAFP